MDKASHELNKWKSKLDLDDWSIYFERISPEEVLYNDDVPDDDRYFIGIEIRQESKVGVIYHDVDLFEEAIVHELLHIKYPDRKEYWINENTKELLNQNKDE